MALVADAGHNLSDVLALAFSWIAIVLSQREPTLKFTYGFRRSTILIALLNTILLLAAVFFIAYETFLRLNNPAIINSGYMMIVAAIGIVVNGFTARLFMKGRNRDLNIRSAFLHFVADALVSFGVVIAGMIIALTGLLWVDSIVSFAIIAIIVYSVYHLLIDSVNLALDAVPDNIKIEEVSKFLENLAEVSGIHDLHIWALGTTEDALTVHLSTSVQTDVSFITYIQKQLKEKYNIDHTTIQIEYGGTDGCGNKF
jgi:cobalt-zinc-cadmium efflux system protein